MAHRDIIVIGASLGGFELLPRLAAGLPADLPAAVLIVQHLSPNAPSFLAERLCRAGPLPVTQAVDGEALMPGHIYVAVPDHHMMIERDRIRLSRGPKESHSRPSVDVLFRSAALYGGPRAIGVVLSGQLDDGTAGLWAIKDRGGVAIVQSPDEAEYPSMPASALRHVAVDYTLQLADIPNILRSLTRERIDTQPTDPDERIKIEARIALEGRSPGILALGTPSAFTCPNCHGSMVAVHEGSIRRFRCHTGHGFSELSLLDQSGARIEDILWFALSQVEERELLIRELADDAHTSGETARRYLAQASELRGIARRLQDLANEPVLSQRLTQPTAGKPETMP